MWTETYQLVKYLRHAESATIALCSRLAAPQELVVVKAIRIDDDAGKDTIHREYEVATKLQKLGGHRHVVAFDLVSVTNQQVVLVMEYCAQGDLFSYLTQQPDRRVSEPQALSFFRQILLGVQFLHQSGIAHRDLSLENVLLSDSNNELRICDFGLSTSVNSPCSGRVGKFNYMAPEVVLGDKYCPVQADVWSLGVIFFILLTGSPLFEVAEPSDPAFQVVKQVGVSGILAHWELEHLYSPDTVALLSSLLQLDPSKRLASVDEVLARLDAFAQQ